LPLLLQVMFPEVLRISGLGASQQLASVSAACTTCQQEHSSEVLLFEELGRLLADVRAFVRRGRTRDVSGMLGQLVDTARKVCSAISTHMQVGGHSSNACFACWVAVYLHSCIIGAARSS
jgi:hypothetical protein